MAHPQRIDALVLVATWSREQGPLAQRAKLTGRAIFKGLGRSATERSSSNAHAEDEALIPTRVVAADQGRIHRSGHAANE